MDMRINSALIKQLRNQRAWSQEQLALISGVSHRTIQRIESSGNCSLETKKALASVFEIEITVLDIDGDAIAGKERRNRETRYGYIGAGLGFFGSYAGITATVLSGGMSYYQAGVYYGSVAALIGFSCLLIGLITGRLETQKRRDFILHPRHFKGCAKNSEEALDTSRCSA